MREQARNQVRRNELSPYATRQDFVNLFHEDSEELYQLSFLLTADHQKAEKCFVAGIEDCANENRVFREWSRSWAKRVVIENAIRELKPRPGFRISAPGATVFSHSNESSNPDWDFDLDAVLTLGDFERFVLVMSVLEHHSHHECALLLGCSVLEIRQALTQALERLPGPSRAVSSALAHSAQDISPA